MAQSYTNPGGSGDRRRTLPMVNSGVLTNPAGIIDGAVTNVAYFSSPANGAFLSWDFGHPTVIDEATWYASSTASHGIWQWQGSQDAVAWTDIGSTFTMGGATVRVHTTLNGNTTPYRHYRIIKISGTASGLPFQQEITFRIQELSLDAPSYFHALGTGDRRSLITATRSWGGGDAQGLVDGSYGNAFTFVHQTTSNDWIAFDLGTPQVVTGTWWYHENAGTHGTWQWQGSDSGASWTDIGPTYTMGGSTSSIHTSLQNNTTAYRRYRVIKVAGMSSGSYIYEVSIRAADPPLPPEPAVTHTGVRWQGDTVGGNFAAPLYDSGVLPVDEAEAWRDHIVSGMAPGTARDWRVGHGDSNGQWAWSDPITVTTDAFLPPATPTIAVAPAVRSAALTGSAFSSPIGATHTETQFEVAGTTVTLGAVTQYTATGLNPDSSYTARVRYRDSNGTWSAWSAVANFNTLPNPVTVTIISPTNGSSYTADTAVLFQAEAFDSGSPLSNEQVVWVSSLSGQIGTGAFITVGMTVGTHVVTVTATGPNGYASASVTITITTPGSNEDGTVIATITSYPPSPLEVGAEFNFTGTGDFGGTPITNLVWSSSIDGAIGAGDSINPALSKGIHLITLTATSSTGKIGKDYCAVEAYDVTSGIDPAVSVAITSWPLAPMTLGQLMEFTGEGSYQGNPITGDDLVWTVEANQFGTGGTASINSLPVGVHIVTLTAWSPEPTPSDPQIFSDGLNFVENLPLANKTKVTEVVRDTFSMSEDYFRTVQ
jgi:hypothetical protein